MGFGPYFLQSLRSFGGPNPLLAFRTSRSKGYSVGTAERRNRQRRTIRKKVSYTPREWEEVVKGARAKNRPPARYMRERTLEKESRGGSEAELRHHLVHQLGRIGNNLNQLAHWANINEELPAEQELSAVLDEVREAIRQL